MSNLLLAVDVGGTNTEVAVTDLQGRVKEQALAGTDASGPEGLLDSVENAVHHVLRQLNATTADLAGVGLGVPGQVHPESGVVRLAVNLNLTSFPLAMALGGRLRAPVAVENDVRLAALGLYHRLQQERVGQSLAYVSVGTGIAAGIVNDGKLLRGANGMAGEIGHVVFDPQGERCLCGLRGCLETIVSGPAIARQATSWAGPTVTARDVYDAAADGNEKAQKLVQRISSHLARALHWLIMSYDVEQLIVGGGVTTAGPLFWEPVTAELSKIRQHSSLAQSMLPTGRIKPLEGDENPGIWGATILAQQVAGHVRPII